MSRTAEPRRGHMAFSGRASVRPGEHREERPGHRGYIGSRSPQHDDRNAEALERRARRRLYADCERAPMGWENRYD